MHEWPAAIWASISAMMAALVITLIFTLGSFAREAVRFQQVDDDAVAILQEYRRFSPYDGTTNLMPADVITAIAETRGNPEIWVDTREDELVNFTLRWTGNTPNNQFKTEFLTNTIPSKGVYEAELHRDANGSVVRIYFMYEVISVNYDDYR